MLGQRDNRSRSRSRATEKDTRIGLPSRLGRVAGATAVAVLLCLLFALPAHAHAPLTTPSQTGTPLPTPAPLFPAPTQKPAAAADFAPRATLPLSVDATTADATTVRPRDPHTALPAAAALSPAAAQAVDVTDDFSTYPVFSPPAGWIPFGNDVYTPFIIYYGGGTTDAHKRLEITDQTVSGIIGAVRDTPVLVGLSSASSTLNFQTNGSGEAGLVIGWKDSNNFVAVVLNAQDDLLGVVKYVEGVPTWGRTAKGSVTVDTNADYRLIVAPKATGELDITLADNFSPISSWTASNTTGFDVRGRVGATVLGARPRVIFDNYESHGQPFVVADPLPQWVAPVGDTQTAHVNGEQVTLTGNITTTKLANIWYIRFIWLNPANWDLFEVGKAYGSPPYSLTFDSGRLFYGWNQANFEIYTIDGKMTWSNYIWLYRDQRPGSIAVITTNPTLVANGQSQTTATIEVRDSGNYPLPGQQVNFSGSGLAVNPPTAITDNDGRASTIVTAPSRIGPASVAFQCGAQNGTIPISLVAGPPATVTVSPDASTMIADGAGVIAVSSDVQDAYGNPVADFPVAFATTLGNIGPDATTNAQGRAIVMLTASSQVGVATVTATAGSASSNASVSMNPGPPHHLELEMGTARLIADGQSQTTVTVRVFDAYNHPVPQALVTFATSLGAIDAQATTGPDGIAVVSFVAGTADGVATISATAGSAAHSLQMPIEPQVFHTYLSLLLNSPAAPTPQPVTLVNGNFDGGNVGWEELVNGAAGRLIYPQSYKPNNIPNPVSPPYIAWLGGVHNEYHQLRQTVNLPVEYAVRLQFSYWIASTEAVRDRDTAELRAYVPGNNYIALDLPLSKEAQTRGWRTGSLDLGSMRGRQVQLSFLVNLNGANISNLFIDNVVLCSDDPSAPAGKLRCQAQ